ncbi:Ionotropic receptor 230, partial [Frankliniella occidentalis]
MSSPTVLLLAVGALAAGTNVALLPTDLLVPAEAASVASLLTRIMPHNGTLFVDSDVPWLDALLRRLPPGMPRVLLETRYPWDSYAWDEGMGDNVILLARDDPVNLLVDLARTAIPTNPLFSSRLLLVTSASSFQAVVEHVTLSWDCPRTAALVVAYPDGSAALLRVQQVDCSPRNASTTSTESIQLLDRWSPSSGLWEAEVNPLVPFSGYYRGFVRPPGYRPRMLVTAMAAKNRKISFYQRALFMAKMLNLIPIEITYDVFSRKRSNKDIVFHLWYRSDVVFLHGGLPAMPRAADYQAYVRSYEFLVTEISRVVYVVPAGLGARRHPLQALVAEYPPALWCLTLLAALSVAVVLTRSSACGPAEAPALLRALAPLLAQPPPGRRSHHPLLGAWMLACVVLAAAYQGLLLKML